MPAGFRFPWVYMGPGVWIDSDVGPGSPRKVHIRLSHTHNNIPRLADYEGELDPRAVQLSIAPKNLTTLRVENSSHLRCEGLTVRHGGNYTARVGGVTDVVFDARR